MIPLAAIDDKFMRLALAEAHKGVGHTSPNPAVGAVIVKGGRVLARGYHRAAGQPHAEIEAIEALKNPAQARGATIYITLEPCSTRGRTPPCSEAIIRHGLTRVVYGATDPNPAHAGRAAHLLRESGLIVTAGVLATECIALNVEWNYWIQTGRPYVIAKCGMSLDGRIGSHPESRWITNFASRNDAMQLRAKVDAILVGGETVRTDNPTLTVRLGGKNEVRQPWRVVWTRSGKLPGTAHLFTDSHRDRTMVLAGKSLQESLIALGALGITSVLIEGGGYVLGTAFDQNLVNRAIFYVAPKILGGGVVATAGHGVNRACDAIPLKDISYQRIESDLRIDGNVYR